MKLHSTQFFIALFLCVCHWVSAQDCTGFSAPTGMAGAMTTVDLSSFGVPANECFELAIEIEGGHGGDATSGFVSIGGGGEKILAEFILPAAGRLIYIIGEAGSSATDNTFGGGGGGTGIFYDPDGIDNNGNEVLLMVAAGGSGAHSVANGGSTLTTGSANVNVDPQVFPSGPAPTAPAEAAFGQIPSSIGGAGGGGFGFDGEDASATVTGGEGGTFAGVSAGGLGEMGANGGAGFGGGGGGGPENQGNDIDPDTDDEDAGGGGGGYVGGWGGAYDDGRDPATASTDRVFRSQGGASYINSALAIGCELGLGSVKTFEDGGQGNGTASDGSVTISCLNVLPVDLVEFTARSSNNSVLLEWITASELNNAGFEVERSKDGRNWQLLDFVKGAGTTVETQRYKYKDETPFNTVNYYRLKQIDRDGKSTYSEIVVAELTSKTSDLYLFPNPTVDIVEYQLSNTNLDEDHTIIIYDWSGRMIRQYHQTSDNVRAIDMSDLNAGTYSIIVSSDTWKYTKVIVKQ